MRRQLPPRRLSESFELAWGGFTKPHMITVSYYHDGSLGEVFISGGKSGEQVEAIARDAAIILSIAMQYGVPLGPIAHSITRDSQGAPSSIIGRVIDELTRKE